CRRVRRTRERAPRLVDARLRKRTAAGGDHAGAHDAAIGAVSRGPAGAADAAARRRLHAVVGIDIPPKKRGTVPEELCPSSISARISGYWPLPPPPPPPPLRLTVAVPIAQLVGLAISQIW